MTWFYLTKEGERPKAVQPAAPQLLPPATEDGEWVPDPRPDEERVLDGYPGYGVAFEIDAPPNDLQYVDEALQAVVYDLTKVRAVRRAEVDARLQQAFLAGFKPDGPLSGATLQVRNAEDRTNWLASAHAYGAAVAAGAGDIEGAEFRTAENETITVSFATGHQILLDMQAWGARLMACSWRLKDAVEEAPDFGAISAVDIESENWSS
jgi:hypothetical protein